MNKKIQNILDECTPYLFGDEVDELFNYITNLQEIEKEHKNCTRKHWQSKCAEYSIKNKLLQNRIDKAIEKYEKCKEEDYCTLALDMYDILSGEDNEQRNGQED